MRPPATAPPEPPGHPAPLRADRWFTELDQREIEVGPFRWMIQVDGVHVLRRDAWVQVALVSEPLSSLVLHLSARITASQVIAALQAWFSTPPGDRPHLVEVLRLT